MPRPVFLIRNKNAAIAIRCIFENAKKRLSFLLSERRR
jgi:hypothetical protein